MRERVLEAIYKKMDEEPENESLQKQIILLGKSNICTIHSFCLDVIKNNFFEIDLPANFKIASEEEIVLLKQEAMDEVFDELYEEENPKFCKLVESYTGYRGDEPVQNLVLDIYKVIQSMPFPEEWLEEKTKMFNKDYFENTDFAKSPWGEILIRNLKDELFDCMGNLKIAKKKIERFDEMEKYTLTLQTDINMLQELYQKCDNWDDGFEYSKGFKFINWPIDKKANPDLKDEVRKIRDNIKKKVLDLISKTFLYDSENAYNDISLSFENLQNLCHLVLKFEQKFKLKKKNKNIIDFSDIEHYALQILIQKDENGKYIPTDCAKKYQEKFEEIAIDEYQDSNEVQEQILKAVSRGNNIFMVGDVKQSIYKFRQARPELFLEKYEKYSLDGNETGKKIQLFKNFRSNNNILSITNKIFETIMSKSLGGIDYTEEEFLNLGADYEEKENGLGKSEFHIIDMGNEEESDVQFDVEEDNSPELLENIKELEKPEVEARFVAKKIKELIKSEKLVKCKSGEYKKIEYRDIVILLRSTSNLAPIFEKELIKNNIPVFSDSNSEYLNTMEIQTIMNLLKVLDNPLDDIKLIATLRSPIGNFDDNEILEIRLINREDSVYSNLINAGVKNARVKNFLKNLNDWKEESNYLSLAELIWKIYEDTGFLNYVGLMANGSLKQANLKMLFERAKEYEKTSFKGLFNFIRFIEKLSVGSGDMSAAKIIGESENVVRIMSIHKSKGLEFPVVFLCSTQKKVNLQDLRTNMLLHNKLGFGPEYINYERKIQYPTAAKQAIKILGKDEAISEEMRILYVALTRAKEKLIITGVLNNVQKEEKNKKELLEIYHSKSEKLNPILIKKYISYLDWIYLVYLSRDLQENIKLFLHNKSELKDEEIEEEKNREFDFSQKIDFEKIDQNFKWEYPLKNRINTPIKSSVSEIKQMKNEISQNQIGLEEIKAKFLQKNNQISSARKGTIIHLILQKLDFSKNYSIGDLKSFINELVLKNWINLEEAENVNIESINQFLQSEICDRIKNAKLVEKEKTFCIRMNLEEYDEQEVSVQGIIDLYFVDENDKIVLLDYKTDFIKEKIELIQKYKIHLEIYKKAIEESLNKEVDEVYIYSTYLNELINL